MSYPSATATQTPASRRQIARAREHYYAALGLALARLRPRYRPRWFALAVCLDTDPELFYPLQGQPQQEVKLAKAICRGDPDIGRPPCPVRLECLAYAMGHDDKHGIWGGTTHNEREGMRRVRSDRGNAPRPRRAPVTPRSSE
jgi:WhiB family transcriptional regulator, redox-sensing transcriptional regulator